MEYGCLVSGSMVGEMCGDEMLMFAVGGSVPVSRLPDLVYETKKDISESGIVSTIVGHVGDGKALFRDLSEYYLTPFIGNFHALLLFRTDEELAIARELVHRMVERAIALDGTCKLFFSAMPRTLHHLH